VQLYYNVTVRDQSGNAQNFIFNHTVEAARVAAAIRDPSSRVDLAKEVATPHIPEMLSAEHWHCAICKKEAETVLLHPLTVQLALDPPVLKDFGGIAVCGNEDCQDSAAAMVQTLWKQVVDASGKQVPADEGIIEVY
jgi:hypothetical protein